MTETAERPDALPTLYHRGKSGGIYSWRIRTEGRDILTEYGPVSGEKQIARKTATPKDVGRANATTAEEHAALEAKSMWQKKRDRKYAESIEDAQTEQIRPMLASDFQKRKARNATYPAYALHRLDGARALAYWHGDEIEIIGTQVINEGNALVLLIDYGGYEFRLGVKEPWLVDGDLEEALARRQGLRGRNNRVKHVEKLSVEELRARNLPLYWNEEWLRAELARLGSYAEIAREHGYPNASTIASYAYRKFGITILKDYEPKRKAATQDWEKGRWTYLEIARRQGVGVATAYRWVAE